MGEDRTRTGNPMPPEWARDGVPAGARAAFGEGTCPVHLAPLRREDISRGGKGGLPLTWIPAGWCEDCRAHWHRPPGGVAGLAVSWQERAGPG